MITSQVRYSTGIQNIILNIGMFFVYICLITDHHVLSGFLVSVIGRKVISYYCSLTATTDTDKGHLCPVGEPTELEGYDWGNHFDTSGNVGP